MMVKLKCPSSTDKVCELSQVWVQITVPFPTFLKLLVKSNKTSLSSELWVFFPLCVSLGRLSQANHLSLNVSKYLRHSLLCTQQMVIKYEQMMTVHLQTPGSHRATKAEDLNGLRGFLNNAPCFTDKKSKALGPRESLKKKKTPKN